VWRPTGKEVADTPQAVWAAKRARAGQPAGLGAKELANTEGQARLMNEGKWMQRGPGDFKGRVVILC